MSFTEHLHLPHYFTAKVRGEIEHLYGSVAIGHLAIALISLFEPIFLYHVVGLSITQVLGFMAFAYTIYAVLIPIGGKIAARYGYAHSIVFSVPFPILYWFLLMGSEHNITMLGFAAVALAIYKSLYWPALHATLARFTGKKQRGREFSMMYAIMNIVQIIGPMLAGFLSSMFGIQSIFVIGSIIYSCSAIPLIWNKEVFVPKPYLFRDTLALYKKYPLQFLGYFGYGEELLVLTIWPIFIYIIVGNYQDLGSLVTVATLVATGLSLYIGFYTDRHSKLALLRTGTIIYALTWIARIPVISPFAAFITDTLSRTTKSLVFIPASAITYENAEQTHIMPFVVGFEQMLAIGKVLAALVGMAVFFVTGSFIALFIAAAIFSLFYLLI